MHIFGHPADMAAIVRSPTRHGLAVVEDAAQAFGAARRPGRDRDLRRRRHLQLLPDQELPGDGRRRDGRAAATRSSPSACAGCGSTARKDKVVFDEVGYNSRLDDLQAAIIRVFYPHLDGLERPPCRGGRAVRRGGARRGLALPGGARGRATSTTSTSFAARADRPAGRRGARRRSPVSARSRPRPPRRGRGCRTWPGRCRRTPGGRRRGRSPRPSRRTCGRGRRLVPRADQEALERQDQCVGAVGDGDGLPGTHRVGHLLLERLDVGAEDEAARVDDVSRPRASRRRAGARTGRGCPSEGRASKQITQRWNGADAVARRPRERLRRRL